MSRLQDAAIHYMISAMRLHIRSIREEPSFERVPRIGDVVAWEGRLAVASSILYKPDDSLEFPLTHQLQLIIQEEKMNRTRLGFAGTRIFEHPVQPIYDTIELQDLLELSLDIFNLDPKLESTKSFVKNQQQDWYRSALDLSRYLLDNDVN